jgi:hypothetical protein
MAESEPPASVSRTSLATGRRSDNKYSHTVSFHLIRYRLDSVIMENSPSIEIAGSLQCMAATDWITEDSEETLVLINPTELETTKEDSLTRQVDFIQQKLNANEARARTLKMQIKLLSYITVEVNDSIDYVETKHS